MNLGDIASQNWTSSSYSQSNGGECVQWVPEYASVHGVVPVRDSKNPGGPALIISTAAWSGLVALARGADL
ncbi:DUF397 domain-containing protein [Streptomyces sp. NPDC094448]|uniref:DUF397 domain-containing protein n=1 Tax=Streptomyces sp. NPDC094448 TaxID=3366063 RepID=UPI00382EDEE9